MKDPLWSPNRGQHIQNLKRALKESQETNFILITTVTRQRTILRALAETINNQGKRKKCRKR